VLSAGQSVEADGKSQSMSVTVVTLLVDPAQAESLTLAANEGHIQLVLRNSNDQKVETTAGRQWRDLYAAAAPAAPETAPRSFVGSLRAPTPPRPAAVPALAPAPVPVAPSSPAVETVILIHGSKKTVETFPVESRNHEDFK
jgi:Flp pilus assembly protein CpaB